MPDRDLAWHVAGVTVRALAVSALLLPLLGGLLACESPSPPQAAATTLEAGAKPSPVADDPDAVGQPVPVPVPPEPSQPVELTPIPGGDQPGPVYFVINTKGVAKLDGSGVTLILDKPEHNLQKLFVGPDGAVYLVDSRSLRKLDGEAVVEVERFGPSDAAPVAELALGPDQGLWVTGSRGVGRREPGQREWSWESREQLGLGYSSAISVGFDGRTWLAGKTKLLVRGPEGQAWTAVNLAPLGRAPLILNMTASPAGFVFATNGKQLIRLVGDTLEATPLPGTEAVAYTADLAVAADGTLALASASCDLLRLAPDGRGEGWRRGRDDYACDGLEAMTVDARGRVWVASREGLTVIDSRSDDPGALVEYPSGSFPALAGRVGHIAVVGLGPELPEPPKVATASLAGTIVVEGKPVAKLSVEACPTVRIDPEGSPCTHAKRRYHATSDAKGEFVFEDVAIGDYSVVVELDGNWRWNSPPSFAAQVQPGQRHQLGPLVFDK